MTANDFREPALGFDDAEKSAHMGATHIRLGKATPKQSLKGLQLAWNLRGQKNDKSKSP